MRRIMILIMLLFLMMGSFIGSLAIVEHMAYRAFATGQTKNSVDSYNVPGMFPVLVVSQGNDGSYSSAIVINAQLANYQHSGLDHTFLIPKGQVSNINNQLSQSITGYRGNVEVLNTFDGEQYLKVVYIWHGGMNHYAGWYVAGAKSFMPKYQALYYNGGHALSMAPVLFVVNALIWGFMITLHQYCKNKRVNRATGLE